MIRDQLSITKKEVVFFIPTRFKEMEDWIKSFKKFNDLKIKIFKETSDCLSDSDLIITKSGTSTLESALYKKKTIVVYKMSAVSFFLLTKLNLINVNYASFQIFYWAMSALSLFNMILKQGIANEAIDYCKLIQMLILFP